MSECEHEPDMGSATIHHELGASDLIESVYVDVTCKKCGMSGCFGKFDKESEVDW